MRLEEFVKRFAEEFDETPVEQFQSSTDFKSLEEWGSLTALSIIAMVDEEFDKYKKNGQESYEYDFLVNLFIKFPFLSFEEYQMRKGQEYRTVESFVQKKIEKKTVDINAVREEIEQMEEVIDDEESFFS